MMPADDDLDRLSSASTSPMPAASGATSSSARRGRRGPTATSSPCSSPRRSPIASRRGSPDSRAAPASRFSRPSTISTSRTSRRSASRSSAPRSRRTSSPRAAPSIFTGKPGRGKTHLAVAIAYRAIQNGFDALFTTAAELIDDLSAAFREGRLAEALPTYTHPAVLVVDEVGYLTYGTDAANMLFHVVNERHRRRALDDLHHQQGAQRLGPRPPRRRPRPGHRRPRPRARPSPHARRPVDPHPAPRP